MLQEWMQELEGSYFTLSLFPIRNEPRDNIATQELSGGALHSLLYFLKELCP